MKGTRKENKGASSEGLCEVQVKTAWELSLCHSYSQRPSL